MYFLPLPQWHNSLRSGSIPWFPKLPGLETSLQISSKSNHNRWNWAGRIRRLRSLQSRLNANEVMIYRLICRPLLYGHCSTKPAAGNTQPLPRQIIRGNQMEYFDSLGRQRARSTHGGGAWPRREARPPFGTLVSVRYKQTGNAAGCAMAVAPATICGGGIRESAPLGSYRQ